MKWADKRAIYNLLPRFMKRAVRLIPYSFKIGVLSNGLIQAEFIGCGTIREYKALIHPRYVRCVLINVNETAIKQLIFMIRK
jgi:hypothetical protein